MPRIAITVVEASTETPAGQFRRFFGNEEAAACHLILGIDADNPRNEATSLRPWIDEFANLVIDYLVRYPRTLATTIFLIADGSLHPRLLFDDPLKDALDAGAIFRPRLKEFYSEGAPLADSLRNDLVFHKAIPPEALIDSELKVSSGELGHQPVSEEMQAARLWAYCHPPYVVPSSVPQDAIEAVLGRDFAGIRPEELFPDIRTQSGIPTLNIGDRVVFRMRPQSGLRDVRGIVVAIEGLRGRETFLVRKGSDVLKLRRWLVDSVQVQELGPSSSAQQAIQAELHR